MLMMYRILLYTSIIASMCILTVSLFWASPWLLTGMIIALGIASIALRGKKSDVAIYFLAGAGGAVGEIIAVAYGAWIYSIPAFFGIPIWLPFLWGAAGVYIKGLSEEISSWIK